MIHCSREMRTWNGLEDNWPRVYSRQPRSIFFTRPFVTGHSSEALRFPARPSHETWIPVSRWINIKGERFAPLTRLHIRSRVFQTRCRFDLATEISSSLRFFFFFWNEINLLRIFFKLIMININNRFSNITRKLSVDVDFYSILN